MEKESECIRQQGPVCWCRHGRGLEADLGCLWPKVICNV